MLYFSDMMCFSSVICQALVQRLVKQHELQHLVLDGVEQLVVADEPEHVLRELQLQQ